MNKTIKTPICAKCSKTLRWKNIDGEPKLICRHCGELYDIMKAPDQQCNNRKACHAEIIRIFRVELHQALREVSNSTMPHPPLPPVTGDYDRAKRNALEAREKSRQRRLAREAKNEPTND